VVFGLGRYGSRLLQQLRETGVNAVGVDFDPEAVRELSAQGQPVEFGNAEDPQFLESLPLAKVPWVITTLPQWDSDRALVHALRPVHYRGRLAGAARDAQHARLLAQAGVAPVLNPFDDAADHAARHLAQVIQPQETTS
jgi:Trk K+ transport system NAD-binding subunit